MKEFFKKLWAEKVMVATVMLVTGVIDLIGLGGKSDIGLGFILGFLALFIMGTVKISRGFKKTKE